MKKLAAALILTGIIAVIGCTNKEGDADLDIITPTDSTQGKVHAENLPQS